MIVWLQAERLVLVLLGLVALLALSLMFAALGSRYASEPERMAAWMFMAPVGVSTQRETAEPASTHGVAGEPGSPTTGLLRYLRATHAGGPSHHSSTEGVRNS